MSFSRPNPPWEDLKHQLWQEFEFKIEPRFNGLTELSAVLEEAYNDRISQVRCTIQNAESRYDSRAIDQIVEHANWNAVQFHEHQIVPQRIGIIFTAYSFTEIAVQRFCDHAKAAFSLKRSFRELCGKGLRRCGNYFSGDAAIESSDLYKSFDHVLRLGDLRNVLTHCGLLLPDGHKDQGKFREWADEESAPFSLTDGCEIELKEAIGNRFIDSGKALNLETHIALTETLRAR